jgi:hypothetical protein
VIQIFSTESSDQMIAFDCDFLVCFLILQILSLAGCGHVLNEFDRFDLTVFLVDLKINK